jgi:hypothetical protein
MLFIPPFTGKHKCNLFLTSRKILVKKVHIILVFPRKTLHLRHNSNKITKQVMKTFATYFFFFFYYFYFSNEVKREFAYV